MLDRSAEFPHFAFDRGRREDRVVVECRKLAEHRLAQGADAGIQPECRLHTDAKPGVDRAVVCEGVSRLLALDDGGDLFLRRAGGQRFGVKENREFVRSPTDRLGRGLRLANQFEVTKAAEDPELKSPVKVTAP